MHAGEVRSPRFVGLGQDDVHDLIAEASNGSRALLSCAPTHEKVAFASSNVLETAFIRPDNRRCACVAARDSSRTSLARCALASSSAP